MSTTEAAGEIEAARRAQAAAEAALADLRERVDNAQALANMGDYDWHIPTDTNRWSDQLFRIYGYEPQSFEPAYERFLSLIHPDDRERIRAIHQQAYETGEPYEMLERIVRPDGEVRYLSSNGQVVHDEDGQPVRMRGTCIDITDRVRGERERESAANEVVLEQQRRRQAVEINDTVLQGLAAAYYALELGETQRCAEYVQGCLDAARRMVADLMAEEDGVEGDSTVGLPRSTPALLRTSSSDDAARR
jgi:PAS domain S-box-containing protein